MSDQGQNQGGIVSNVSRTPLTAEDLTHHSQELGVLGKIFGSRENAPFYIAAMAIIFSFAMIACILVLAPDNNQALTLFGAIITGALGFIFGRSS
jgi:hypothetical protein